MATASQQKPKKAGREDKGQTVKIEIEVPIKVYELLKILAKHEKVSIKEYALDALYTDMEGLIDYGYYRNKPKQKAYSKILRSVFRK